MRIAAKEALVTLLREQGVQYVFGIPGATEIHFMDALEQAPDITYVLGLHEVVCAGMAEGYARTTGRPGVLNLHTAPGLAAATPLLYNAQMGKVPLVVTVGQNDTRLLQKDPHLTGDITGIGRIHAKWSTEVLHSQDLPLVLRRAFKMAQQAPCGPVVVSLPQDVLQGEVDFEPAASCARPSRPRADREGIEQATALLSQAQAPLVLIESGVARSDAVAEVVRLAELVGAPVYQAWMADVNFPVSHPLYLGDLDPTAPEARDVLAGTDLIVGVGCSLFAHGFLVGDPALPEGMKTIHIDEDPWEIGKNLPTECGLLGDIKATLTELDNEIDRRLDDSARAAAAQRGARIAERKQAAADEWEAGLAGQRASAPIPIRRLLCELRAGISPDTVVVDEAWSASAALRRTLIFDRPGSFFRARKGGSIGSGLPMALGVKLGLPDRPVLAVVGDGSAAWSMQSLWTAARCRIPVTFIITNNAIYGQVKLVRKAVLGDYPLDERHAGMEIDNPVMDFSLLARAMGVDSQRVTDAEGLGAKVASALASGKPHLIEVMVERAS